MLLKGRMSFSKPNDPLLPSSFPFIVEDHPAHSLIGPGLHNYLEPVMETGCLSVTHTDCSAQLWPNRTYVHITSPYYTHTEKTHTLHVYGDENEYIDHSSV